MATTTVQSPPTEADIRAHIDRALDLSERTRYHRALVEFHDGFSSISGVAGGIWDEEDLRPSEDEELGVLAGTAIAAIRDRALEEVREALVQAALTFAAKHPDAPRGKVVPA